MKINSKRMIKVAAVAALYATLTLALAPISYGNLQFRVSEILVLLAFFDPFYIGGLTLGCFIANMLGPNGAADMILGTLATLISVFSISLTGKFFKQTSFGLLIASLWPTVFNGLIIGAMLHLLYDYPLVLSMLEVAIGEFGVVSIIGIPVFIYLMKRYPHFFHINQKLNN